MKLVKYSQFSKTESLNENLDQAKKFLKNRYLLIKAAEDLKYVDEETNYQLNHDELRTLKLSDFTPEQQAELNNKIRTIKLSPETIRDIERDKNFLKLKELLKDNIGYLYTFVYFYYVEMVSYDDLVGIYEKLRHYKDQNLLDKLPKKFDQNFIDPNIKNNTEVLIDGFNKIEEYRKIKKVVDCFTSKLKSDYAKSPTSIKDQIAEIADLFDNVPEEKKERVWKSFFGEMRLDTSEILPNGQPNPNFNKVVWSSSLKRYENMENPMIELIRAAKNHLKATENDSILNFYDKINECNQRFGNLGVTVLLDEGGILVMEVKSFQANQLLNGHTRHCIKDSMSQWDSYIGNHHNKQYYIYNFNISQGDQMSVIGVTIAPNDSKKSSKSSTGYKDSGVIYNSACHRKDDGNVASSFKSEMDSWTKKYKLSHSIIELLNPLTDEEIKRREKGKIAEREIIKKGISAEDVLRYVREDGANINKDNCIALLNAVEEDDFERAKVILELGGNPNLNARNSSIISYAKNFKMILLLLEYNAILTPLKFDDILEDSMDEDGALDNIEVCLKHGLDPNFSSSYPLRRSCKGSYKNANEIGQSYFDIFMLLIKKGAQIVDSAGARSQILNFACEYGRRDVVDYLITRKEITNNMIERSFSWSTTSGRLNRKETLGFIEYYRDMLEEKIGNIRGVPVMELLLKRIKDNTNLQ